jgi:2-oxoisovalerate dehydrogenase E1 component
MSSLVPDKRLLGEFWRDMYLERILSERIEERNRDSSHKIINIGTRAGQEAVMVGFCLALRRAVDVTGSAQLPDWVCGFGGKHFLPMGVDLGRLLADAYGKATGYTGGKAGAGYIGSSEHGIFGHLGLIGVDFANGVGLGMAAKWNGQAQVVGCISTDGGSNTGRAFESINLAVLHQLPVVFAIVNNWWATSMPVSRSVATGSIAGRLAGFGLPSLAVDGQDVLAVHQASVDAVERARRGGGPTLLEFQTYRYGGQNAYDEKDYRPAEEVHAWLKRDPIPHFRGWLLDNGFSDAELRDIESTCRQELDRACRYTDDSPFPDPVRDLARDVMAPGPELQYVDERRAQTESRTRSYAQAIAEAQAQAMRRDQRVFLMGLDIGRFGSHDNQTAGLWQEFGDQRVLDMPIVEATFTGIGSGAARAGYRPIVALAEMALTPVAGDELFNAIPSGRYASGGQYGLPIVVRMHLTAPRGGDGPTSGPIQAATYHAVYTHLPGIVVAAPSTPFDAKGLLLTAIACADPVYFIEHRALMRSTGPVPPEEYYIPFGKAAVRREGADVTVVAVSFMVSRALAAAELLARDGIQAEVIDPRTLVPLDSDTILRSVSKTGRLVTVDQGHRRLNFGAEVIAQAAEQLGSGLRAAARVAAPDIPVPAAATLTGPFYPSADAIAEAVRDLLQRFGS